MLYVVEVSYEKENLPIIDDIWHLLTVMDISTDGGGDGLLSLATGEIMQFADIDEFKIWAGEELDVDPIFIVIDMDEKSVYYYEADPTIKFTKLEGNTSFEGIGQRKEDLRNKQVVEFEAKRLADKEKEVERLNTDIESLLSKSMLFRCGRRRWLFRVETLGVLPELRI